MERNFARIFYTIKENFWSQGPPKGGVKTVCPRIEGNKGQRGQDVYPGSGPLNGGKTLRPA